jgi:hypothetical protein
MPYSQLSQIHYVYNDDKKKARRRAKKLGWKINSQLSNNDIITYTKDNDVHLNYSGTDITNPRDIISDIMLATGKKSADFTARKRRTRDIMRQLGDDKQYTLSGHSLGGSIGLSILQESQSIRDRVKEGHFYNPGLTAPFAKALTPENKQVKNELNDKVTIHRVKGDIVSEGKAPSFGKVIEYEPPKGANLLEVHKLDTFD